MRTCCFPDCGAHKKRLRDPRSATSFVRETSELLSALGLTLAACFGFAFAALAAALAFALAAGIFGNSLNLFGSSLLSRFRSIACAAYHANGSSDNQERVNLFHTCKLLGMFDNATKLAILVQTAK